MSTATFNAESSPDLAQSCARLLRPIARLAFEGGLPVDELEAVMRQVVLQEAQAAAGWNKRWARVNRLHTPVVAHA
jgi:hypothetical protein